MLPSHSTARHPGFGLPLGEADPDLLDDLVDSSRRLGACWPLVATKAARPSAPGGSITVPDRTRELVAGMAEYGL
ncbi:hypothetical protein [Kitasatospora sp. LaBMicrA B282]|uniref:hypothetical protein n=1 Tax=Kitasatospora sp. LaBMicrA B282 TaxID=3420949 RepID=UPI003D141074